MGLRAAMLCKGKASGHSAFGEMSRCRQQESITQIQELHTTTD
jgi:hypothetical protein